MIPLTTYFSLSFISFSRLGSFSFGKSRLEAAGQVKKLRKLTNDSKWPIPMNLDPNDEEAGDHDDKKLKDVQYREFMQPVFYDVKGKEIFKKRW